MENGGFNNSFDLQVDISEMITDSQLASLGQILNLQLKKFFEITAKIFLWQRNCNSSKRKRNRDIGQSYYLNCEMILQVSVSVLLYPILNTLSPLFLSITSVKSNFESLDYPRKGC